MAQFHFVEDYERYVAELVANHPIDRAMELAVGDNYERVGGIELALLRHSGLSDGVSIVDLGCGSGRLASALSNSGIHVDYTGIDIVQALLDYAKARTPEAYRFLLHRELSVPLETESADFACAFSVFTHLLHHETFIYMEDIRRVLKNQGRLVFSFLEFAAASHWGVFKHTVDAQKSSSGIHLNMFVERTAIEVWAGELGYEVEAFIDGNVGVEGAAPLGQSTAILRKL